MSGRAWWVAVTAAVVAWSGAGAGSWAWASEAQHSIVSAQATAVDKRISFGDQNFDPLHEPPTNTGAYRTAGNGKGLRFVQFQQAIRGDWLEQLRSAGVRPLQYYPHDTYLVWADDVAMSRAGSLPQVRWQGDYLPQWKIEPGLEKRAGRIANIGVHFYNDGDIDAVLNALQAHGAWLVSHGPAQSDRLFHDAWIEVDADRLADLARLPQVVWLEYASPQPILDDEMSSQIVARNYNASNVPQLGYLPWLSALGYDGSGLTWAVIDSGVDYTHPDFAGRIVGGVTYPGCAAGNGPGDDLSTGGHGTHVAGILGGTGAAGFADGQGFLYGIGMAPGVGIFAQNPICAGGTPWPPSGGWQRLSKDALTGGAIGGNGSWTSGEGSGTTYTAAARTWDQITRDGNFDTPLHEAFIMVFSAGNSGPGAGTLTAPKAAKNVIVTGGTQNYRVSSNIDAVYNSSSLGPTQDGRYGITIAAPAQTIASARRIASADFCSAAIAGTSNHYAFCTGTSMAAPHASGTAVLIADWWRDHNEGAIPSPAMVKALLINGAKDYGGGGSIPNTTQGWGRIDVPGSLGLDYLFSEYTDQSVVLDTVDQVHEVTYQVPEPDKPLKVSLAWTDAAAAVAANPTLVNNLDLEVETDGELYRGNVFTSGWSTTGGSADNRNNQENVYVAKPGSTVTIRVIARNLPGDGIPGNATLTDQDFALVCRNCVEGEGFTFSVTPSNLAVCTPNDTAFGIQVGSVLGYDEPVHLSVSGLPAGATSLFTTNPVIPTGSSQLQIATTGVATAGSYPLLFTGTSPDASSQVERYLHVATDVPPTPALLSPAHNAVGIGYTPTLTWEDAGTVGGYYVQLATDSEFNNLVLDQTVSGTSVNIATPLTSGAYYYWRVRAGNVCGDGEWSPVYRFRTQPAPGDCDESATTVDVFSETFSGGNLSGFTTTGSTGAQTWAYTGSAPAGSPSGGGAALAVNIISVSDQRLISPAIDLPTDSDPLTLQFWNHQHMEARIGGCFDGGLLEISTDGGSTWTQVTGAAILNRAYDGPISAAHSNPLANLNAWCGDSRPWENYIIDVSDHAGQTVQFRWRLGTDSSVARPGWHLDDIRVQACQAGETPIAQADLGVTVAAVPNPVFAGGSLTYLVQVASDGPDPASGVQVSLELPVEVEFDAVAAGTPPWLCVHQTGTVVCELPGILAAGSLAPDLDIAVTVSGAASGVIGAQASVSSQDDDPNPDNDSAVAEVLVLDPADVIFIDGFELK